MLHWKSPEPPSGDYNQHDHVGVRDFNLSTASTIKMRVYTPHGVGDGQVFCAACFY